MKSRRHLPRRDRFVSSYVDVGKRSRLIKKRDRKRNERERDRRETCILQVAATRYITARFTFADQPENGESRIYRTQLWSGVRQCIHLEGRFTAGSVIDMRRAGVLVQEYKESSK